MGVQEWVWVSRCGCAAGHALQVAQVHAQVAGHALQVAGHALQVARAHAYTHTYDGVPQVAR